jgi:hypothetical protein
MDESNLEPATITFIAVGSGAKAIANICDAERALVMVSVPWSAPERKVRILFTEAAAQLQHLLSDRPVLCFRLEVDEDLIAQSWLVSLGYGVFIPMGAGSLIWLNRGKAVCGLNAPLGKSVQQIVERTMILWGNSKA